MRTTSTAAHWGMNTEYTGPVEIWGSAEFPTHGLWDVHGNFLTHAIYANGDHDGYLRRFPQRHQVVWNAGGFLVCNPGLRQASPTAAPGEKVKIEPLVASDPKILDSETGRDEIHLYTSTEQHANWLECIRTRRQPTAPVEIGHRACSTCLLHHIAMKTNRRLYWDPRGERFKNDPAADAMLSRPQRSPYTFAESSWV